MLLDKRLGFLSISRLGHDLDVLFAFKQLPDPRADDVVVIR